MVEAPWGAQNPTVFFNTTTLSSCWFQPPPCTSYISFLLLQTSMPPKSRKARRISRDDMWDVRTLHELYGIIYDASILEDFLIVRKLVHKPSCENCGGPAHFKFRADKTDYYWRCATTGCQTWRSLRSPAQASLDMVKSSLQLTVCGRNFHRLRTRKCWKWHICTQWIAQFNTWKPWLALVGRLCSKLSMCSIVPWLTTMPWSVGP